MAEAGVVTAVTCRGVLKLPLRMRNRGEGMISMRKILAAAFIVAMLDAATTYIMIASGRGAEANPFLQFINDVPETVFFVQIIVVFGLACLLKIFEILAAVLPAPLRTRVYKAASAAFTAAVAYRAAVVVNNVLGIFMGITPLADALYA